MAPSGAAVAEWAFNEAARVAQVELTAGLHCLVIDNALDDPQALVDWAANQQFFAPTGDSYPGVVAALPEPLQRAVGEYFDRRIRSGLGGRRTLSLWTRLSMVTLAPEQLTPVQWLCHRDRLVKESEPILMAAMVLYLYRNQSFGGTAFYRPRVPLEEIEPMLADGRRLSGGEFEARYGINPGYIDAGNRYFERTAHVDAAWNRMIFYDGGQFHSPHIGDPRALSADARSGRLTLNGFFICSRRLA